MNIIRKIIKWISDLRVAIVLLLIIAIASGIGTAIPQGESTATYLERYADHPWIGLINGKTLIRLQLDHIYSSSWFLILLTWLGLALLICSWRRQWPTLQASLKWIDYQEPRQLSKLALAETIQTKDPQSSLNKLAIYLKEVGWNIKEKPGRFAARKGVIGRAGPLLVHIGMIILMLGAVWGTFGGQKVESFLAPGRSFELVNREGENQLTLSLIDFEIERDPAGRTEQFRSKLKIKDKGDSQEKLREISVNHPLRYKGMTIYQADWSLAAITLQIGQSPKLQLPLNSFPELGEQVWGLVLPTNPDGTDPIVLSLTNESGPIQLFDPEGDILSTLLPGGEASEIKGRSLRVIDVLPASGLLLKRDPGVPLVYTGFLITLLGAGLSILATRQLWAICDSNQTAIHVGGLCNRDLPGLANEIPKILILVANQS